MSENGDDRVDTHTEDLDAAKGDEREEGGDAREEAPMSKEEREAKAIREGRKAPANVEDLFTLKVDNIPNSTTAEFLRQEFGGFGEIGDIYIPKKFKSDELKGFAFVRYVKQRCVDEKKQIIGANTKTLTITTQSTKQNAQIIPVTSRRQ
jgi:RNA recognition motif-containing protein